MTLVVDASIAGFFDALFPSAGFAARSCAIAESLDHPVCDVSTWPQPRTAPGYDRDLRSGADIFNQVIRGPA